MENIFKTQYILPLIYFMLVVFCITQAFDYEGRLNSNWWLVLSGLTIPWSFIGFIFMWALIHGAGLEFFTIMYIFFALINGCLIYLIIKPKKKANGKN